MDRIISVVPFLNGLIRPDEYREESTILREDLSLTYGLASKIWGEFYALGLYVLMFTMYLL